MRSFGGVMRDVRCGLTTHQDFRVNGVMRDIRRGLTAHQDFRLSVVIRDIRHRLTARQNFRHCNLSPRGTRELHEHEPA
jgi:hypothetical protein